MTEWKENDPKNKFWKGVLIGSLVTAFCGICVVALASGIWMVGRGVKGQQNIDNMISGEAHADQEPETAPAPALVPVEENIDDGLDMSVIGPKLKGIEQAIDQYFLFDEEKEDWLLGIGGSAPSSTDTSTESSGNKESNNSSSKNDNKNNQTSNNNKNNNSSKDNVVATQTPSTPPKEEHTHNWDNGTVTKEPSCSNEGVKTFTCATCSDTKVENISKKSHSFTQKVESSKYLKTIKY